MIITKKHVTYIVIAIVVILSILIGFILTRNRGGTEEEKVVIMNEASIYPSDIESLRTAVRYTDEKGSIYWVGASDELGKAYALKGDEYLSVSNQTVGTGAILELSLTGEVKETEGTEGTDLEETSEETLESEMETSAEEDSISVAKYQSLVESERYVNELLKSNYTIYKRLDTSEYCDIILKSNINAIRIIITPDRLIEDIIDITVADSTDYIGKYIK